MQTHIQNRPINLCVCMYFACVISQSSNDGLSLREDLIRPTKLDMDAKFVENSIFVQGIRENNDAQNLKLSFIY